jgi:hypothetical protein
LEDVGIHPSVQLVYFHGSRRPSMKLPSGKTPSGAANGRARANGVSWCPFVQCSPARSSGPKTRLHPPEDTTKLNIHTKLHPPEDTTILNIHTKLHPPEDTTSPRWRIVRVAQVYARRCANRQASIALVFIGVRIFFVHIFLFGNSLETNL